jgi:hypothetical protein
MDRFSNDEFLVGLYLYSNMYTICSRHKPVYMWQPNCVFLYVFGTTNFTVHTNK